MMIQMWWWCSNTSIIRSGVDWTTKRVVCPCFFHQQQKISTTAAKSMLGFPDDKRPSIRELRNAYFAAAKRCHPDVLNQQRQQQGEEYSTTPVFDFRDITDAYEHLLNGDHIEHNQEETDNVVTCNEEEEYRDACKTMLGLPAEIVEESKQNPMFRRWLEGNTDAALHWRSFFAAHGGLAQKLRPVSGYLGPGIRDSVFRKSDRRRKRGKRTPTPTR